jgi:2-aminoethylphosphonate-pyruvate transaminase
MRAQAVKRALILGAGMGVRLRDVGRAAPKGFLRLGERPIVEESILRLAAEGIERVVIATGHHAEFYEQLAHAHDRLVVTVENPRYADSGSLYSLWCARDQLDGDFLLLESDLIYERAALRALIEDPRPDVLLISEPTGAHDEVWVETRGGDLVAMSKDRAQLGPEIAGELVGITKVSLPFLRVLLSYAESRFRETLRVDYETDGLVHAAHERPLPCKLVPGLVWAEIDDPEHLERARKVIYPRLVERDGVVPSAPALRPRSAGRP